MTVHKTFISSHFASVDMPLYLQVKNSILCSVTLLHNLLWTVYIFTLEDPIVSI